MKLNKFFSDFFCDYKKISKSIKSHQSSHINCERISLAVICAEDKYFFSHHGVSIKSIFRAIIKRHGGASTITMQLVRVISGRYEVTMMRKIREVILAMLIERKYNKFEILDTYLSCSYFGSGLIGINNVMKELFKNKAKDELSSMDCYFIAALLKRPVPREISISWACRVNTRMKYIENVVLVKGGLILEKIK
ncbi:biosynthetic peptidoglycan transglycosylase [Pectobacterium aroidearum]|uniref:biosynthetic peptidoglycan transglycosylase n=2 Tax=Pectobacteriaceae TaxID=1903410 RepID=UPI0015DEFD70|nr:biosynthetic peptidoglycan transglycosylase [Pectobacterium aroidearum]MBA0204781.1 transglycosylase domain-containing protein [Pectobacterium aroidearum]MBA5235627.1 transglycosylase domain-containing protein [Pectobacterium aroidearum]